MVKPAFFQDERLYDLEAQTGLPIRVIFIGLWCVSDREGRFDWNPRRLKVQILPHDDSIDLGAALAALKEGGFILDYEADGRRFGYIPGFLSHQVINNREVASTRPDPGQVARKPAPQKPAPQKPAPRRPAPQKPAPRKPAPQKLEINRVVTDLDKRAAKVFRALGINCQEDELWRLGGEVQGMIMDSAQQLDDEGVEKICANATAWLKSATWIKVLTPRLIMSRLGEIYAHQSKQAEKPRRLL